MTIKGSDELNILAQFFQSMMVQNKTLTSDRRIAEYSLRNTLCFFNTTSTLLIWAGLMQENLSRVVNNKGIDQPVQMHSLVSAFVIHFLESIIAKLASKYQFST